MPWVNKDSDDQSSSSSNGVQITPKHFMTFVIVVMLMVFCAVNTQTTEVDFLFKTASAPLFIVIAASAVLGGIVGAIGQSRNK